MNKPLFSCIDCGAYQTVPAEMLSVYEDDTWCSECWDNSDMAETIDYEVLPSFVPEYAKRIAQLESKLQAIQSIVDQQAEDPALWLPKCSITEAYHQQEMRKLHAVLEGES